MEQNNKLLTQVKIKIGFLLMLGIMSACKEEERILEQQLGELSFKMKVKKSDLTYDGMGYPSILTLMMEVSTIEKEDLIEFLIKDGLSKEQLINYLSFDLQKSMHVNVDGKKLPISLFHFERSFDLKTNRNFLITIDLSPVSEEMPIWFVVDSSLFGDASIKFNLNEFEIYKS